MDHLPPLRLLATLNAIARSGSLREAAQSLNVTQPAVTQALKALEDHIGAPLLDRSHKPARLNAEGRRLADAVEQGVDLIARAIDEIRATALGDLQQLTIASTIGMATHWLMPRLPDFYHAQPSMVVNVQAPPNDLPRLTSGIDLALRYGDGQWRDGDNVRLFDEVITPVGHPALVARLRGDGVDLSGAPLIHVRSPENNNWATWPDYLRHAGVARKDLKGAIFDNYVQAVQATLDGRGVMLGWRSITQSIVDEGRLVRWSDTELRPGAGYFVTCAPHARAKPAAAAMIDWLVSQAR